MLTLDFAGLLITICLAGIRYPHYVLLFAVVHDFGMILTAIFLQGQINTVVTAGVFSTVGVSGLDTVKIIIIAFSGTFINYSLGTFIGGSEFEKTAHMLNSLSKLRHPMSVINLRLAFLSFFVTIWKLYWQ